MLRSGRSAIGFAVGQEPLASVMAASGVTVVATDLAPSQSDERWLATGQHADGAEALFHHNLVERSAFGTGWCRSNPPT